MNIQEENSARYFRVQSEREQTLTVKGVLYKKQFFFLIFLVLFYYPARSGKLIGSGVLMFVNETNI